jgi:hypothetical protein
MTVTLTLVFLVAALACFLLSAFSVPTGKINTVSLAWAFIVCAFIAYIAK